MKQWMRNTRILITLACTLTVCAPLSAGEPAGPTAGITERLGAQIALDTVLKDESANDVTLRRLIDKPTLLAFIYFRCRGICPVLLNGAADVINRMTLEPGRDFEFIAVSFDETDTPAMARQRRTDYLNQMKRPIPPKACRFLTGDALAIKMVTDSAGFAFRPQENMYIHPGAIIVLTPDGNVSRYLYGSSFLPADLEMAIQDAAAGRVRPTISKVLSVCYTYDPEGRRYVFNLRRTTGVATLLLAGGFLAVVLLKKKKGRVILPLSNSREQRRKDAEASPMGRTGR